MYNKQKTMDIVNKIMDDNLKYESYVLIGMPLRDNTRPAQNVTKNEGMSIDFLGFSFGYIDIVGEVIDVARNYIMEYALEKSGAKYLLFLGEDTVMQYDGFLRLHETAEANPGSVVGGVYYIKMSSPMVSVEDGKWIKPANVDPGQIIEARSTGMDAMLIPIDVLRKLKEQDPDLPFCVIYNESYEDKSDAMVGEDYYFCYRLRKAGIKILINTDVQCLHVDLATGKYTAHPSINLSNYQTQIELTEPLTIADKTRIDTSWFNRYPPLPHLLDRVDMIGETQ